MTDVRRRRSLLDLRLLGDFLVLGGRGVSLGTLGEISQHHHRADQAEDTTLADHIAEVGCTIRLRPNEVVAIGPIKLVVQKIVDGKAATIGLQLAEPDPVTPETLFANLEAGGHAPCCG